MSNEQGRGQIEFSHELTYVVPHGGGEAGGRASGDDDVHCLALRLCYTRARLLTNAENKKIFVCLKYSNIYALEIVSIQISRFSIIFTPMISPNSFASSSRLGSIILEFQPVKVVNT